MKIRAGRMLAAVGATAVIALTGCGGGGDHAGDTPSSSAAPSSASSAPSGESTGATDASGGSLAAVLARTVKEGSSAHLTLDLGRQGSGEGDMTFDDDAPALQLRVSFGSRTTEIRVVDGTLYVAVPGRDGKFLKMDLGQAGSALGIDPSRALEELQRKSGDFTEVGDGHWQARHDGVTTDLFVGDDGYPEKIQVEGVGSQTMTMTFSDWGEKVTVKAPAAADVVAGPSV
jgi:hypothetical protein